MTFFPLIVFAVLGEYNPNYTSDMLWSLISFYYYLTKCYTPPPIRSRRIVVLTEEHWSNWSAFKLDVIYCSPHNITETTSLPDPFETRILSKPNILSSPF